MMDTACRVSVIVPVYNVEEYLALCLDSLLGQTMPQKDMEILLVNDGSTDGSPAICEEYAKKSHCIRYFSKENEGLTATRNFALRRAAGKYMLFLDSDDALSPETLMSVADFFDRHYEEVDLVTYKIQPYRFGKKLALHYRYRFLQESGVYDLDEFPFATQTTINICVKNCGEDNIFFDPAVQYHEDQKYNIDILSRTFRLGYCAKGEYRYNKNNSDSITASSFYAYYMFEIVTRFWEGLFARWPERTPPYVQAMFLNDINWKIKQDILFPYHYPPAELAAARERVRALLHRVDDAIILNHPMMDIFHAQYFLRWKYEGEPVEFLAGPGDLGIVHAGSLLYTAKKIELFVTRFNVRNGILRIIGFLKSPVFNFTPQPRLFARRNGRQSGEMELSLRPSSWSHYKTKIQTNSFWGFLLEMPLKDLSSLSFSVLLEGWRLECAVGFLQDSPFQPGLRRRSVFWDGLEIRFDANVFYFAKAAPAARALQDKTLRRYYLASSLRVFAVREALRLYEKLFKRPRVWLYYDCKNVRRDNACDQFLHDLPIRDGAKRYYVVNDKLDRSDFLRGKSARRMIRFGSWRHKWLFLQAEKIVTAYIEPANYIPLTTTHVADFVRYDLIYLQHGVLHAHLPWKYSLDRLNVDKMVISTHFERRNLIENYGFSEDYLLPAGMPRFDRIDRSAAPQRKILLGPSWRKYLVGMTDRQQWLPKHKQFLESAFFRETIEFLNSEELAALLEKHDYTLELQLHPILRLYEEHFVFRSARVKFAPPQAPQADYAVFITDISSFVFDFAYLKRPVLYFVPDLDMFKAGMNDYRELDLPLEEGLGPLSVTARELLPALQHLLENDCAPTEPYRSRVDALFLDLDHCCDKIYEALKD